MKATSARQRWMIDAVSRIEADFQRSADTHLIALPLPGFESISLYLKDESSHPTGSLKHRLARSLFLYALCNGWLHERSTVVESSSGSTAVSEAYFARLLGLPFVAVMPATVSTEKIRAIEFQGGRCHLVDDPTQIYAVSRQLAKELDGHYMDQFTYAERATDWRSNNNIAESIFTQMQREPHPVPSWIVCSAGTGGTLATMGRYVRYGGFGTRVCGADAERSVFFDHYLSRDPSLCMTQGSRIEGIGRPRVEASFLPSVLDAMVKLPDAWSVAAMLALSERLGRPVGPSTGTNLLAALACAVQMRAAGEQGSVVTLLCDSGERYRATYHDEGWRHAQGWSSCEGAAQDVHGLMQHGQLSADLAGAWRVAGSLEVAALTAAG
ncbi:PLP-dependent cysteine synthase family protein [Roseateles sp. BYS180W]|uniref:L-cysteine desulfhydrase Cds1 n=1 Tax=Roseateles rivi TaxID=3299028 RepID=A0ABW7FVB1_9BURK